MTIDLTALLNFRAPPRQVRYTQQDTILYALGVGCGAADDDLPFIYEQGLQALPTMAVTLGADSETLKNLPQGLSLQNIVHGEQSIEIFKPIPVEGLISTETILDTLCDQGVGHHAILRMKRTITDVQTNTPLACLYDTLIARNSGGFGGSPTPLAASALAPERPSDRQLTLQLSHRAAALYRLTGDTNPLHIDPIFAKRAGFNAPILHGLCTLGSVVREIMRAYFGNDPARITHINARFAAPVFPGDILTIHLWEEPDHIAFEVDVRNTRVLKQGIIK